MYSQAKSPVRG